MQRAGQKETVSRSLKAATPTAKFPGRSSDQLTDSTERAAGFDKLQSLIRHRINSRLPGRIRDLCVTVNADGVFLDGQCATYYTKQLAQHAALGVLEDEPLHNKIVVSVPR